MSSVKRILLVEDSVRDLEMALEALEQHGLGGEVLAVRDGAEALDYLYRRGPYRDRPHGEPCLILLDIKMPKVDGLEVLRQVKADPALKVIPIVVMTSSREDRDLDASYELGANGYVVKPMRFSDFTPMMNRLTDFWTLVNEPPTGTPKPDGGA